MYDLKNEISDPAFVWNCGFLREDMTLLNIPLFSTMCFQTSPQIACLIALFILAALLTFPHCAFSNESSNGLPERIHWLHLFGVSALCVFKCLLKLHVREEA